MSVETLAWIILVLQIITILLLIVPFARTRR